MWSESNLVAEATGPAFLPCKVLRHTAAAPTARILWNLWNDENLNRL